MGDFSVIEFMVYYEHLGEMYRICLILLMTNFENNSEIDLMLSEKAGINGPGNTKHFYNICTATAQPCTNVIKMFCV